MSLHRAFVPLVRSSRFPLNRGIYHLFTTSANAERRRGHISIAVASTLGLSLATFYALVDPVHADRSPDHESLPSGDSDDAAIRALHTCKSVDKFSTTVRKNSDELLRKYEESHMPPSTSGILRYDIAQVASNNPLEDDHSEALITSDDSQWSFFAVLDGHSGWETSALLREKLIKYVTTELRGIDRQALGSSRNGHDSDPFATAIARGFTRLDDHIVHQSVDQVFRMKSKRAAAILAPAYAGACALLAFYDSKTSVLRIALTGDCRAVLGRKRSDGKFDLEVLTADQTGDNPKEKERLEAAHPGEQVVKNGRTMGFGPARAFGDARYKWSREIQEKLKDYLGRAPLDSVKTPPYFTAEPVVTATNVKQGDFVVLATDGLWECLTNKEVVGLVGRWIHQQEGRQSSWVENWTQWWGSSSRNEVDLLPVTCDEEPKQAGDDPSRYQQRYDQWRAKKSFVTVDANAATHLVRNALGGANEDLREALLGMRSPRARNYWDDITATVVFFS